MSQEERLPGVALFLHGQIHAPRMTNARGTDDKN